VRTTLWLLQDALLQLWERTQKTVIMVTHDVDEALYLSTRVLLMSDGPRARIADTIEVPFPRPRARAELLRRPDYFAMRGRVIQFLETHAHRPTH
jgi:ABC-type nitrate/sulfonate/bicarbonate transport system ATPase subunit